MKGPMGRKTFLWMLVVLFLLVSFSGYHFMAKKRSGDPGLRERTAAGEENENAGNQEQERNRAELRVEKGDVQLEEVMLQHLGHSCFLLEANGLRILMDPYSPDVGYETLNLETQIMTVSHEHMDHNYTAASPRAKILRGLTIDGLGWDDVSFTQGEIHITSMPTYHDGAAGKQRGRNAAFIFNLGNLRIVHLGDLGHLLNEGEIEKLTPVDILLIPVGGHYTINAREAKQVIAQLSPAVAIPMHYQTKVTRNWPLADLKPFLEGEEKIKEKGAKPVSLSKDLLPESTEIWLLEPGKLESLQQNNDWREKDGKKMDFR
jgi:L-ascorbate metabolism protein UlaG (beta-lactamase superfamily)